MELVEMTNAKNPLSIGSDGNVKTPLGNVDRMERNGFIRAGAEKAKPKTYKEVK